jgi:hypothetical protein
VTLSRRSFFTKLAGAAVAVKAAPSLSTHIGAFAGALDQRGQMSRAIAVARWKWGVFGEYGQAPTFQAPDPFDRRDFIAFQDGGWWMNVHTDDPAVRIKGAIDEDVALRILGVDPAEATKSLKEEWGVV